MDVFLSKKSKQKKPRKTIETFAMRGDHVAFRSNFLVISNIAIRATKQQDKTIIMK